MSPSRSTVHTVPRTLWCGLPSRRRSATTGRGSCSVHQDTYSCNIQSQSINRASKLSIKQSTNRPKSQSINQSIKQSTNQSFSLHLFKRK